MKYIYPAIFTHESSGYSVKFPDLESCYTQGENLQDAMEMAADVLCLTLHNLNEQEYYLPRASDVRDMNVNSNSFITLICCDTVAYDNRAVKKTLTIPAWLNQLAEDAYINFSATLTEALKEKLHIKDRT